MIILKGRVLDGNGGQPIEKGAVVLEGNRIVLVCRQSELPEYPNAQVYTLPEGTIMPGLIDAHVHMGWGSATSVDWISMTPQVSMARALARSTCWPSTLMTCISSVCRSTRTRVMRIYPPPPRLDSTM